jgi:hypothetical protein
MTREQILSTEWNPEIDEKVTYVTMPIDVYCKLVNGSIDNLIAQSFKDGILHCVEPKGINPWCKNADGSLCDNLRNLTPYCCDNCLRKQNYTAAVSSHEEHGERMGKE